ncbi:MAG: glycosyltransferase family 4 protein [Rubrivivax sp.]
MIRLLVLVPKPTGLSPGQRFRLEQWAPMLARRHGIHLDFVPFESPRLTRILYEPGKRAQKAMYVALDMWRRRGVVRHSNDYDGVVVHREGALAGPALFERLIVKRGVPLFYDFDDAIWVSSTRAHSNVSTPNGIFSHLHFFGKTSTICKLATAVTVGNEYLAEYARQYNPNVHIVPTSIDLDTYAVQPEPPSSAVDDAFVIGWSGSTHTLHSLEVCRSAIERFGKGRRVVLRVICNRPLARPFANVENLFIPWREEGEAREVGACHVGIMPLKTDEFSRGKCGLKALQFMATGRPVVVTPVGVNTEIVQHGENGFIAGDDDAWVDALEKLSAAPDVRRTMGSAARRTVEQGYSSEVVAAKFARAVRQGIGREPRPNAGSVDGARESRT